MRAVCARLSLTCRSQSSLFYDPPEPAYADYKAVAVPLDGEKTSRAAAATADGSEEEGRPAQTLDLDVEDADYWYYAPKPIDTLQGIALRYRVSGEERYEL